MNAVARTERLLDRLPSGDSIAARRFSERAARVLRPQGALAALDDVGACLARWQRTETPAVARPAALVFAADHGVAAEGVSAYPAEVTASMVAALRAGVATSSVLAREVGVALHVVDVGVGRPTGNLARDSALTYDAFESCFDAGRAAVAATDADLLVLGEMGIANTTAAAAVCHALYGLTAEDWTGRGTGVHGPVYARKVQVVQRAVERASERPPLEVLRELGGSELVALAGAVVEARLRSIPVALDGFVVTAAVAPLDASRAGALDHCIAAHCSSEPGHRLVLDKLGMRPLLDLDLRLGEGSGALLAVPLIRAAAAAVTDVATFYEWGLASPDE